MPEQKPALAGQKKGDQVRLTAEYLMKQGAHTAEDKTISGPDLFSKAKEEFSDLTVGSQNSYLSTLSQWVNDPASKIICPGRKQGYYYSETLIGLLDEADSAVTEEVAKERAVRKEKEKHLYPLLKEWLMREGYRAKDTSVNKAMGRWGNPDLTGLHVAEQLARFSLEVVTIEAKASIAEWQYWIFEAVSHRRFANRSYFAFAHPEDALTKIPQEMRYYAELYGIGVLVVSLDTKKFEQLVNGKLAVADADMVELYSAPYHPVQPRYQDQYCRDGLNITTAQGLLTWGDTVRDEA